MDLRVEEVTFVDLEFESSHKARVMDRSHRFALLLCLDTSLGSSKKDSFCTSHNHSILEVTGESAFNLSGFRPIGMRIMNV